MKPTERLRRVGKADKQRRAASAPGKTKKTSSRHPARRQAPAGDTRPGVARSHATRAGGGGSRATRPGGKDRATNPGGSRRRTRNGEDEGLQEVLDQYESFHGREARGVNERQESLFIRKDFAKCGRLLDLLVWLDEDKPFLLKPKGVNVVTSGDGGSIYFQGGDQELPLEGLGLDQYLPKDHIRVGEVQTIAYHTAKGFHNFEPRDYTHEFAEDGGEFPTLNYDVINKLFYLTGGSYQVRPEGIVN